jgi:chromosome segregation ATPase
MDTKELQREEEHQQKLKQNKEEQEAEIKTMEEEMEEYNRLRGVRRQNFENKKRELEDASKERLNEIRRKGEDLLQEIQTLKSQSQENSSEWEASLHVS